MVCSTKPCQCSVSCHPVCITTALTDWTWHFIYKSRKVILHLQFTVPFLKSQHISKPILLNNLTWHVYRPTLKQIYSSVHCVNLFFLATVWPCSVFCFVDEPRRDASKTCYTIRIFGCWLGWEGGAIKKISNSFTWVALLGWCKAHCSVGFCSNILSYSCQKKKIGTSIWKHQRRRVGESYG